MTNELISMCKIGEVHCDIAKKMETCSPQHLDFGFHCADLHFLEKNVSKNHVFVRPRERVEAEAYCQWENTSSYINKEADWII